MSDDRSSTSLRPGDRLGGKYRLERLLGQGAAGHVWLAVHETIGRSVAIKVLRSENKGRAAVRFLQEARIAASLQSRYVVSTFDFGNTQDGLLYMVMEHLHGETLGARLARDPPLRVRDLIRYLGQALVGLHEVHRAGIVHRDLKPENIFLVEEAGEVYPKLLDFGVCRAEDSGFLGSEISKLTATGMTVGTPLYMAPEQARGKRDELDARTDLYAIGVILYRAISGQSPFEDTNVVELLMAATSAKVAPALVDVRADVPEALSELVQRAMAPQQQRRFADAEALRAAMAAVQTRVPESLLCQKVRGRSASTDEHPPLPTLVPGTDLDPTLPASVLTLPRAAGRRQRQWRWVLGMAAGAAVIVTGVVMVVGANVRRVETPAQPASAAAPAGATGQAPSPAASPSASPSPLADAAEAPSPRASARSDTPGPRRLAKWRKPAAEAAAPTSDAPPKAFTQPDF